MFCLERLLACESAGFDLETRLDSYLFVFSFGQSKGKADKFRCIMQLDVLRESSILVSGRFRLGTKLQWCLALMSRRISEAATEGFPHLGNFFAATLFRYPTNVEIVLGIVETEENG